MLQFHSVLHPVGCSVHCATNRTTFWYGIARFFGPRKNSVYYVSVRCYIFDNGALKCTTENYCVLGCSGSGAIKEASIVVDSDFFVIRTSIL